MSVAGWDDPNVAPDIVTGVDETTVPVVIGNVVEVCPDGITQVAGTCTAAVLLDERDTVIPAAGAG